MNWSLYYEGDWIECFSTMSDAIEDANTYVKDNYASIDNLEIARTQTPTEKFKVV